MMSLLAASRLLSWVSPCREAAAPANSSLDGFKLPAWAQTDDDDTFPQFIRDVKARGPVNTCSACRGYGIVKCDLCKGQGIIMSSDKLSHSDPCPKCLVKRYIVCPTCKGGENRKHFLFAHLKSRLFDKGRPMA